MPAIRSPLYPALIRAVAGVVAILLVVSACIRPRQEEPNFTSERNDIYERLSQVIARNGFKHGMRSAHVGSHDTDMIYIDISLDSLKRRHSSLDKLMADIGSVCALPDFAHLPIQIVIGAQDQEDRIYLRSALAQAVGGKPNVDLRTGVDVHNEITIIVRHRSHGGS